jgi:hypothetical protein
MRVNVRISLTALAAIGLAVPAQAVGIGDLAKVVLGGGSILKKGDEKCGSKLGLTRDDSLAIAFARAAAERALPRAEFTALDKAAEADANKQAQSSTFCGETKKKKSGLMSKIKKAGKSILAKQVLGG